MNYVLIYDAAEIAFVNEELLPLWEGQELEAIAMYGAAIPEFPRHSTLLLYLSDLQVKVLLPVFLSEKLCVAALPHPAATDFSTMMGTESKISKAVQHLLEPNEEEQIKKIDLLYCNNKPVFRMLAIGSTFLMAADRVKPKGWRAWMRRYVKGLLRLRPLRIEIERKNGSSIHTAVAGLVVVTHKSSAVMSRFIPGESFLDDGMLHAVMVSPRSLSDLVTYAVQAIWKPSKLPAFAAHIKSDKLIIKGPGRPLEFLVDKEKANAEILEISVAHAALRIRPGRRFDAASTEKPGKEVYKLRALPEGETAEELASRPLPLITRASTEEFKELFMVLRDNAQPKSSFLVLMVLSTILATFGLFSNSSPVVIGAMILAPLMAPIISLSMATLRQDRRLILDSISTVLAGLGLSFIFAVIITWITPISLPNDEILARTRPNLLDLGIAVVSGVAGAYAHAREEIAKTLAGVAIAVALVPPLAVAGIGFGWFDWNIFMGALLLLGTNLAGMVLAGAVTFMALGYSPFKLATKGLLISLAFVAILSIPLFLSFNRMVYEHKVMERLNNWETETVTLKDVRVQGTTPLLISVKLVSPSSLDDLDLDRIKKNIEARLDEEVELEISISRQR